MKLNRELKLLLVLGVGIPAAIFLLAILIAEPDFILAWALLALVIFASVSIAWPRSEAQEIAGWTAGGLLVLIGIILAACAGGRRRR